MAEIELFDDEPLRFQHILVYPYPDLRRLWVRAWLPPQRNVSPNVEYRVLNPDGSENNSMVLLAQTDTKLDNTLHLREPVLPGATYRMVAELSVGLGQDAELVDRQEFELVLEFRDPEAGEPGFGVGLEALFPHRASRQESNG